MKLLYTCPYCNKPTEVQCELEIDGKITRVFQCGHLTIQSKIQDLAPPPSDDGFYSLDNTKECYPFQKDGIAFAEKAQLNVLFADAMGLGKTVEALVLLKRNYSIMSPCLFIVKPSLMFQWTREFQIWTSLKPLSLMPVIGRANLVTGFENYIISMDLLARKGILDKLVALGFKSVIIDESHSFKDPGSARTRALIKLLTILVPKVIALSGTPIKNRANEYFTILNILAPEYFRSLIQFQRAWLIQNEKGQYTRIAPWKLEQFRRLIAKWVIRREKHEVLTNLPPFKMDYIFIEIEDENVKASYNTEVDLFANFLNNTAKINSTDILGWLARLRKITGIAKCPAALEWAAEFLDSTEENLAIGIQHCAVRDTLYYVMKAGGYSPLKFSGEDSAYRKDDVLRAFNAGDNRLLIINEIAGGYGLNLQCCANFLTLEQQWNEADMEQFASRFHRDGQKRAVNGTEMLAHGTIDEFFYNLRMQKKQIFGETIQGWSFTEDFQTMRDLAETVISNKLK